MTHFAFTYQSDPGTVFRPGAFDGQIGSKVTVKFGGFGETGTLLTADVAEDGRSVRFTLDVEDNSETGPFSPGSKRDGGESRFSTPHTGLPDDALGPGSTAMPLAKPQRPALD